MSEKIIVFQFAKDINHSFNRTCDSMASAANFDGPAGMIGKTDISMPWRNRAADYKKEEQKVLNGQLSQSYQYVRYGDKDHLMLHNKSPLFDKDENVVGIVGSCMDMTDLTVFPKHPTFMQNQGLTIDTGSEVIYLTKRETVVLKWILHGKMAPEISLLLKRSQRTIEGQITSIKRKFQSETKGDIINMAHQFGLLHLTFAGA